MKMQLLKTLIKYSFVFLFLLAFTNVSWGAAINNWTGATSSDWNTASNWSGGIPKSTDAVQIGVVAYTNSSNQPTLNAAGTCASITIGNACGAVTLTINTGFTLTVSGAFTINTPTTVNIANTGTLSVSTYLNNGTTTFGSGVFSVTSTAATAFNNNSGTTTFGTGTTTIAGDFNNTSGTTNFGTGASTLSGAFTITTGIATFGTGLVTFNAPGTVAVTMKPNATLTFGNVLFTNTGHFLFKTNNGATANFAVASTGTLTLSNNASLNFANVSSTQGLTLKSDANGSATIAAIPAGCSINAPGKVSVERYIQGSSSGPNPDLSKRGYRLLSSPIYTANDGTSNVFDFQYLLNSVYVSGSGGATNGFNVNTTQNPSIYLFREDVTPPPSNSTIFTTSYNWKGVAKINNSPAYLIGTQAKNTTANILNATVTIPVGNGVLFLFRGDKTASLVAPLTPPNDVTLTQTGTLNTGTINVKLWFAGDASLGNNLSYTPATTAAVSGSTASLTGGFTLVGNPYASTINWEKFNRNGTNSSIYGGGNLPSTIWVFNVLNKQYEAYNQRFVTPTNPLDTISINPGTATGSASNMIASGQGFFIQTSATGQTLSFRETAKTNTLPVAANLLNLMGKPKEFVTAPQPLLRLKLSKDSINTDEIAMLFDNNSSTKYIQAEDAFDMGGGSGSLVSLSAYSSDGVQLAINSMPLPGLQQQVTPLLVDATASGVYKLESTQLANLPAMYEVWLKDAFTNDSLNMKANSRYQFTIDRTNPATFGSNRFTLVIRQNPALAYKLLDFSAARVGNSSHVEVVWHTQNEQNYTNFTVERSNDGGKTFAVAGGLQATGAGNYSLVDKNAAAGQNFYWLKQEDLDNTVTYSKIVEVLITDKNNSNADQIHVYPNPAINVINLDVTAKAQGNTSYDIVVTNSSGFTIKQATSSQASWQSGVSDLLPGTYLVKVINNKDKSLVGQSKFVKL